MNSRRSPAAAFSASAMGADARRGSGSFNTAMIVGARMAEMAGSFAKNLTAGSVRLMMGVAEAM